MNQNNQNNNTSNSNEKERSSGTELDEKSGESSFNPFAFNSLTRMMSSQGGFI